jgi:hypothetical protein
MLPQLATTGCRLLTNGRMLLLLCLLFPLCVSDLNRAKRLATDSFRPRSQTEQNPSDPDLDEEEVLIKHSPSSLGTSRRERRKKRSAGVASLVATHAPLSARALTLSFRGCTPPSLTPSDRFSLISPLRC